MEDESDAVREAVSCFPKDDWSSSSDWKVSSTKLTDYINLYQTVLSRGSFRSDLLCFHPVAASDWVNWEYQSLDWPMVYEALPTDIEFPDYSKFLSKAVQARSLEQEFNELAAHWYRETRKLSAADQMVLHPAYQKIIGMGKDALPFIFKELKRTRGHWIWALVMILRDDIAKPEMNFKQAVDAWLDWGERNGYI